MIISPVSRDTNRVTPPPLPAALRAVVESLMSDHVGDTCSLDQFRWLSFRLSPVARATLTTRGGQSHSVIVKHVPLDQYPVTDWQQVVPEFREERFNYRFLATVPAFRGCPRLVGEDPSGVLMLADLGDQSQVPMRAYGELIVMLAGVLADLHGLTRPHLARYHRLRAAEGLAAVEIEDRKYGLASQLHRFEQGRTVLRQQGKAAGVPWSDEVELALTRARQGIFLPGPLWSFIHDDLCNARQTAEVHGVMHLLDLEQAKFGHSLMDLGKPMLGKFEVNLGNNQYVYSHPDFPMALADAYRQAMADRYGMTLADGAWHEAMDHMLTVTAIHLLGRIPEIRAEVPALGDFMARQWLLKICKRLVTLLYEQEGPLAAWLNRLFVACLSS